MKSQITRRLEFDYGHRILGHESRCASLHGHRGVVEITVEAPDLDHLGRVVDFSVIKEVVGGWIDSNWDHTMILNKRDPLLHQTAPGDSVGKTDRTLFGPRIPYIMHENPTAENMARELGDQIKIVLCALNTNLRVVSVRFWETPNSSSEYRPL
jgi:6-pyruvoyltetrahydropterin/6-carboxytetrahydropterin synthase